MAQRLIPGVGWYDSTTTTGQRIIPGVGFATFDATATSDTSATGAVAAIVLAAPVGAAASDGSVNATGAPAALLLVVPSASAQGTTSGVGMFRTPTLKNNTGTVLANETGVVVNLYDATSGALVVRKTGLMSDAQGVVTVVDAALTAGTSYAYEVVLSGGRRRLPVAGAV